MRFRIRENLLDILKYAQNLIRRPNGTYEEQSFLRATTDTYLARGFVAYGT